MDMDTHLREYVPVLLLMLLAIGMVAGMMIASALLGRTSRRQPIKDTAYECGMLPLMDGVPRFSVKFYLVAVLFILFDIEVVFLYPWAVVYRDLLLENANLALLSMLSFLIILFVGYLYALKKGAFSWHR
jgi:NADH-quinone oxidoreductase subunit A